MTANSNRTIEKPEISRYAFAMFDVLGFTAWVKDAELQTILDAYQRLIELAVLRPNEKGSLSTVQTPEGALFAVGGSPHYAYFSDTIMLWCPLVPPAVADFVERCSDIMCEALSMNIPLRGAIALGDAVLDNETGFFIGKPIVEAYNVESGQEWIGLTLAKSAVWSPFLAQLHGATIIEYPPPMKERKEDFSSPIVVDWPRRWRDRIGGECPSNKLKELNTKPEYATKWLNTIKFAEYSLKKHDWHLRLHEIPENALLKLVSRKDADFG
ncbi:MAG: hypothetical protein MN733_35900 [Nitrososphaera sp.]|nr:hypothetical protein [Nitrososphaera sp.]